MTEAIKVKEDTVLVDQDVYELTLVDRMGMLAILPGQGDLTSLRILRDLEYELAPTEEEARRISIRVTDTGTSWNSQAALSIVKSVSIGDRARELVKQGIEQADREGRLDRNWLGLYERFLPSEE